MKYFFINLIKLSIAAITAIITSLVIVNGGL